MNLIHDLINESTDTSAITVGRPKLLSLTNAVNGLIFRDLVAFQPTNYPVATLFGLRFLDPAGQRFFHNQATYSGEIGDRSGIESFSRTKKYVDGDIFKTTDNSVFKVMKDGFDPTNPEYVNIDEADVLFHGIIKCNIRLLSDAMSPARAEDSNHTISENSFKMDRWSIELRSRKIKTAVTNELIKDLQGQGFGESIIYNLLQKSVAEDINKDILQKLIIVSTRHKSKEMDDSFLDLSGTSSSDPSQARELYRHICDMAASVLDDTTFRATYCVCTPKVQAMLAASGWLKNDVSTDKLNSGILKNGITVYTDTTTAFDYAVVGTVVHDTNGDGIVGSLFYAPYTEGDGVSYHVARGVDSLQDTIMINSRYGLSVNPYTNIKEGEQIVPGDDWELNCGSSRYSRLIGIKF